MEENREEERVLPFSSLKQNALLGHLLINERFFKIVYLKILPNWFLSERNAQIYKMLVGYHKKYGSFPKEHEFLNSPEMMQLDPKERAIISSYIARNIMETQQIRLDSIKPELTEWLHSVILMKGLGEAKAFFNKQDIKQCHAKLMSAVKEVTDTTFDSGEQITFSNYREYLKEQQKEREHCITTGLKALDSALLKDANDGGLLYKDTTVVMAPVNEGKTTFMITVAAHNILQGKDVLFMTHEGNPKDIRLKFISNMLKVESHVIFSMYQTEDGCRKLDAVTSMLEKHLKYVPYNKAGQMFIERVVPIVRINQEDWASLHAGKGFDLLCSDYPALLTTEMALKGHLPKREQDRIVYDNYVQLAIEYGFHSLVAIQTNREGSKINKGLSGEGRMLEMEDVKESWDPMAEASNVITLNRPPDAARKGLLMMNLAKTRSNEKGVVILAKSDYGKNMTHSNELGGMSYRGMATSEELVENIWEHYVGGKK
jgi:replicative DNA helicase